jgi:hypothetical protein
MSAPAINDGKTPCPHCGKRFKVVNGHITKIHNTLRVEVRKVMNTPKEIEDFGVFEWSFSVRILRNGEVICDWETPMSSSDEDEEFWFRDDTKAGKWGDTIYVRVVRKDYAVGDKCDGEVLFGKENNLYEKDTGVHKSFGATMVFVA